MTQRCAVTQMKRIFARTKRIEGGRTWAPSPSLLSQPPFFACGPRAAFSTLPLAASIRLEMRDVFEIVPGEIEIRRTFVGLRRAVALCCDVNG